jgi:hypothetical protein
MEVGMIRWGSVLAALIVGIALWGLPPEPLFVSREWAMQRTPEREAYLAIEAELLQENWQYQRIQWRDSLTSILLKDWEAGRPYRIGVPSWAADSISERLDLGVKLQLQSQGIATPSMPVGVFLVPKGASSHSEAPDRYGILWSLHEFYVAREDEDSFCYLVAPVGGAGKGSSGVNWTARHLVYLPRDSVSDPNTLRLCAFFAEYGDPGARVMEWLRRGGFLFGVGVNRDQYAGGRGPLRGVFGLRIGRSYRYEVSPRALACLGDDRDACRALFLFPKEEGLSWGGRRIDQEWYLDRSAADFLVSRWGSDQDLGVFGEFVLADLEGDFGSEKFGAFWRSEKGVGEAFLEAFGEPPGEWLKSWAWRHYGEIDRGPGVPVKATFFTFLTLGILAGGAVYMGRR